MLQGPPWRRPSACRYRCRPPIWWDRFSPMPEITQHKKPPRVRKPSARHDVIYAPTADLDAHRAMLRATFGTFSEEFADTMMGKVISGLRPNAYDLLEEATLNAALATVASLRPESEIEALMCVQTRHCGLLGAPHDGAEPASLGRREHRGLWRIRQQAPQASERPAQDPR